MNKCKCGSYAINIDKDGIVCDICFYKNIIIDLVDGCKGWKEISYNTGLSDKDSKIIYDVYNKLIGEKYDSEKRT